MQNGLHRLTYVSTAARTLDDIAIDSLVEQARSNNARLGITGILLFNGLNFLQTIEGPGENVLSLFQRISADSRHNGVVRVQNDEPPGRAFVDWSMAFMPVGRAGVESEALRSNGFAWSKGAPLLPAHLESLYLAFNSLGRGLALASAE